MAAPTTARLGGRPAAGLAPGGGPGPRSLRRHDAAARSHAGAEVEVVEPVASAVAGDPGVRRGAVGRRAGPLGPRRRGPVAYQWLTRRSTRCGSSRSRGPTPARRRRRATDRGWPTSDTTSRSTSPGPAEDTAAGDGDVRAVRVRRGNAREREAADDRRACAATATPSSPTPGPGTASRTASGSAGCATASRSRAPPAAATPSGSRTSASGSRCASPRRREGFRQRPSTSRRTERISTGCRSGTPYLPRRDPRRIVAEPGDVQAAGPADLRRPARLAGLRHRVPPGRPGGAFVLVLSEASQVPTFSSGCSAEWSCRVGRYVIINQMRWLHASPMWREQRPLAPRLPAHGGQPRDRSLARARPPLLPARAEPRPGHAAAVEGAGGVPAEPVADRGERRVPRF